MSVYVALCVGRHGSACMCVWIFVFPSMPVQCNVCTWRWVQVQSWPENPISLLHHGFFWSHISYLIFIIWTTVCYDVLSKHQVNMQFMAHDKIAMLTWWWCHRKCMGNIKVIKMNHLTVYHQADAEILLKILSLDQNGRTTGPHYHP